MARRFDIRRVLGGVKAAWIFMEKNNKMPWWFDALKDYSSERQHF